MKLPCWLTGHTWVHEHAILNSGYQCRHCRKWQDGDLTVEREREAWTRVLASTGSQEEKARWTPLVVRELMKDHP